MNERLRRLLIAHGGLVFLAGMAAGFPFAFFVLGKISLWPIPGEIDFQFPGTVRGWRMAHLEGILNGITCIAVAAAGQYLTLSERAQKWVAYGLIVTAWGNVTASVIGPVFSSQEGSIPRGLAFGSGAANSAMYLLFVLAVVTVIVAMMLVVKGALRPLAEAAE